MSRVECFAEVMITCALFGFDLCYDFGLCWV